MQSWPTSCTISLPHNVLKFWIMRTQGNAIKVTSASLEQQWTVSLFELSAMPQKEEGLVCKLVVGLTKAINPHKESLSRYQASNYYQLLTYFFTHVPKMISNYLIRCWTKAQDLFEFLEDYHLPSFSTSIEHDLDDWESVMASYCLKLA